MTFSSTVNRQSSIRTISRRSV